MLQGLKAYLMGRWLSDLTDLLHANLKIDCAPFLYFHVPVVAPIWLK